MAGAAFTRRGNLISFWQQTAELFYPERADFDTKKTLGEDFASSLYAGDQVLFRRDFGNWVNTVLRPKGRLWAKPRARLNKLNKITAVAAYFDDKAEDLRNLLYDVKSQYMTAARTADHDWVTFGNSVESVEERSTRDGFIWRNWHLRDCAWEDNEDGETHIMYRRFKMSIRNLMAKQRTGWRLSKRVIDKYAKTPDELVSCLHIAMPVEHYYDPTDVKQQRSVRFEWVSVYLDEDNKFMMSEKQVRWFPYTVSRWFRVAGSPYAFSPCVTTCLPDARTIQAMTWSILEAGEKAVEPPIVATHEAVLGGVDLRAGHVTWIDRNYDEKSGVAIRALDLGKHPELGDALRQGVRGTMMEAWYLNRLFLPQFNHQMTAEETARRHEEFLRASQPIIDPAEEQRIGIPIDVQMQMAMDLGYWGPMDEMPREIRGRDIDVTYDNPIEDARKQSKTMAFGQVAALSAQAREVDPTLPAHVDWTKAYRDAVAGIAPPDWLHSEDKAKEITAEAEKDVETQGAIEEAGAIAEVAATVEKARPKPVNDNQAVAA